MQFGYETDTDADLFSSHVLGGLRPLKCLSFFTCTMGTVLRTT